MFITFRLAGSLPDAVEEKLRHKARLLKANMKDLSEDALILRNEWKRLFHYADKQLDKCERVSYLKDPVAATAVVESIFKGQSLNHYILHRFCIMPNHVHLLIEPMPMEFELRTLSTSSPGWPPKFYTADGRQVMCNGRHPDEVQWRKISSILKSMKGSTSRHIKQTLQIEGSIWRDESYDHWVRDEEEYCRIITYIDNNPVKAGLCRFQTDWTWGSVGENSVCR
jgi:REP element-mobilizing transposase RayT